MNNTKIKILFGTLLSIALFGVTSVLAAGFNFKSAPVLVSQTSSGVNISWEIVDGATGYLIMYSTKSSSGGTYENELPDLVEGTGTFVSGLNPSTKYYLAVSAFDSDFNEVTSPELVVDYAGSSSSAVKSTSSTSKVATSKFTMTNVEILSSNEIKVSFSNDLSNEGTKEFMLTPKDNKNSEIKISSVRNEGAKDLVLSLASPLDASLEYELVAITVSDLNNNNIESGVDGMVTFSTPAQFPGSENVELNSAPASEMANTQDANMMNADSSTGTVDAEGLNAAQAANDAQALPTTGPKEMFMLVLALALGGAFLYARKRKLI